MYRVRMFGSLTVMGNDTVINISSSPLRSLMCAFASRPGQVLSTAELMDWLWSSRTPKHPVAAFHTYVYRLRRMIESDRSGLPPIILKQPGYVWEADPHSIDTVDFRARIQAISLGTAGRSRQIFDLRSTLAIWQQSPLLDIPDSVPKTTEVASLEDHRLHAMATLFELELEMGRHQEIIPEVRQALSSFPYHEQFSYQLMTALRKSHRRWAALQVFNQTSHSLKRELGIEPGLELRQLYNAILTE